jgi:6-phosphogluconolactonase
MIKSKRSLSLLALLCLIFLSSMCSLAASKPHSKYLMYIGTYTENGSESQGIYAYRFDSVSQQLESLGLAASTVNPSFLAIHPNRRFLYAVNEISNYLGQKSGAVSAFAIDRASGKLTLLNQVASRGADPCYVTVDKTGKYVLVANYTGGSIAAFPIRGDGGLGEASAFIQHTGHGTNPQRQEAPHAHSIDMSADNRFAIVDDLGLDETLVYPFDSSSGVLGSDPRIAKADAGAGPRHFALHPNGKFGYVLDEMGSQISVFSFDSKTGAMKSLQTISSIPKSFSGLDESAEIEIAPSGKFLYASNRGHDSIAVFAVNSSDGTLSLVEYVPTKGSSPRNFEIAPEGSVLFAANEKSDNIVLFRINRQTGRLTATDKVLDIAQPVCVKFVAVD